MLDIQYFPQRKVQLFVVYAPKLWNILPKNVRNSNSSDNAKNLGFE